MQEPGPCGANTPDPDPPPRAARTWPSGTLPRVAFVDDDVDLLAGLRRALHRMGLGWELAFHSQPAQALSALRAQPADVVVADIRMPGMNGVELASALAADCPQTVCLVLSGSTDFDLAISSINVGRIFRYLVKPCPTPVLVAAVEAALRRHAEAAAPGPVRDASARVAIDLMRCGVIVLGPRGQVMFTNQRAGTLLVRRDAVVVDNSGICRAAHPDDTRRLHTAIRTARDEGTAAALTLAGTRHGPLRVVARPGDHDASAEGAVVCLYLFAADDDPSVDPQLLRGLFGLTASESRLAAALAGGLSLEAAAEAEGWTLNSAKTYLRTVFQKMDVSRQADLVRVILGSLGR